jgi:peptide/nickel transport system substrate-binding protein
MGQPDSLNPITENNSALREISPLLFATLLQTDPQTGQLQPDLAERWEYSRDGKEVLFYLPARLKWSDGSALTAAAIVTSLKATEHPALAAFSQITAPDPNTIKLTFARIDCAAVTTLAQLPLLPASQILAPQPMGSGPFRVADWSENKRILKLTRNPYYGGPKPALAGLTVHFLSDNEAAIALSEGQFDLVGPLPSPLVSYSATNYSQISYLAPRLTYLAINADPKNGDPLPAEVKQALPLALDREAIVAEALNGQAQLLAGSLLPGHWAANPDLAWPKYDPPAARRWLARANLKDEDGDGWLEYQGQRLELAIRLNSANNLHQNLGWLISSYYRELGLFARTEGVSVENIVEDLFTHDFTLAIFSWPALADPDQRLFWNSTKNKEGVGLNFTSFDNPKLDQLLEQGIAVPGCALETRAKVYREVQELLAKERPADFLLAAQQHLLVGNRLQGLAPGPFAPFTWNITAWYLQPQ